MLSNKSFDFADCVVCFFGGVAIAMLLSVMVLRGGAEKDYQKGRADGIRELSITIITKLAK